MLEIMLYLSLLFLSLNIMFDMKIFISLLFSSLICSVVSLFISDIATIATVFAIISATSVAIISPVVLILKRKIKLIQNINENYIGKNAFASTAINQNSGIISINNERWQARTNTTSPIDNGDIVKIIGFRKPVLIVEKENEVII